MSDIRLNLYIKEENHLLFKRCIRKLLESTFIVGDKDEKLYAFISRESNRQDAADYLRMIGFDVIVDSSVRIAMLVPHGSDEESAGLRRANVLTFTDSQYHMLLVLWEIYLENLGTGDINVVTRGDLIDRLKAYNLDLDKSKLSASMKLFRKYDLIDFDSKDQAEDALVTLYPSLQFGWNISQFRTVADEYLSGGMNIQNYDMSVYDADGADGENAAEAEKSSEEAFSGYDSENPAYYEAENADFYDYSEYDAIVEEHDAEYDSMVAEYYSGYENAVDEMYSESDVFTAEVEHIYADYSDGYDNEI